MEQRISRTAFFLTMGTALFLLLAPNFADWTVSHIYHPDWTAHSRFHTAWQLVMQSLMAIAAIALCLRGKLVQGALLNLLILSGFYGALLLTGLGLFDGGLTDLTDGSSKIAGLDANLMAFSVLGVLQLFALWRAKST